MSTTTITPPAERGRIETVSTAANMPDATPTGNLEITVSRAELLRELTAAQSVVERKTTIPILSNFLFEATDDKLTITATDLDQSLRTSCTAKVKKPGACTIPARKLYDYIKLLPEGDISIKLMDNHWVQIRAGRSNTKMVGMARANFPQVPEFPAAGGYKLSAASLKNMVSKTIFAISNEESRYTLNGALLVLKAESMAMVATDGHRLAHIEKLGEQLEGVQGEKKTLIPRKALSELCSAYWRTPTLRRSTSPTTTRRCSSASAAACSPAASSPASSPTTRPCFRATTTSS